MVIETAITLRSSYIPCSLNTSKYILGLRTCQPLQTLRNMTVLSAQSNNYTTDCLNLCVLVYSKYVSDAQVKEVRLTTGQVWFTYICKHRSHFPGRSFRILYMNQPNPVTNLTALSFA